MADLLIVAFPDEAAAFAARGEMANLQKEYLIEMEDIVVVTRDAEGKIKLHQPVSLTAAGAVSGTFWGMLIGMLFFMPLFGAAVGAAGGALGGALTDIGIDDKFLKECGAKLKNGQAAVAILIRKMTADKVLEGLEKAGIKGDVVQTSLSNDAEAKLRAVLEKTPGA